jgi:hypothetical protein
MKYKIDNNIPIPSVRRGRKNKEVSEYELPIHKLEIGQSIGTEDDYTPKNASKWRSKILYIKKKMQGEGQENKDIKFVIKEYEGKVRVWRVS